MSEDKKPESVKPELTKEEIQNLRNCCILCAKQPNTSDVEMKYLLNLCDKLAQMV